jgi:hypothetical protein
LGSKEVMADANSNKTSIIDAFSSPNGDAKQVSTLDKNYSLSEVETNLILWGQSIDFEIVGLYSITNGRSCCCHKSCRKEVVVENLLRLNCTVADIDGRTGTAVKLVRKIEGIDGCTVGFVPRVQSKLPRVAHCLDKFAVVCGALKLIP